jgi:hypothetical protein
LDLMTRPPEASRDDPSLTCTIKAIPPALQRLMAERANETIVAVAAWHVSFASQPEAATQLILQAVEATTAAAISARDEAAMCCQGTMGRVAVKEPSRTSPACSVELPAPLNAMLWR